VELVARSTILPSPELPPGPRAALVIATGSYADQRLRTLRAPAQDAETLTAVLRDPLIGRFEVTALRDRGVHEVRVGVEDFLATRGREDTVVVYVSCHGLLSPRRRLYFAAADTDHERLASTGLDARWLIECLDECRARRQVVILDCCFSGAFALTKGAQGPQSVGLEEQFGAQDGRGRIVLTASRATEYSYEGDALSEGGAAGSVFTAALVDGLRTGAADQDGDGLISVSDAYGYLYARVQAGGAQTPQRWIYGGEGEVLLARSSAGITVEPAPLAEDLRAGLQSRYPGMRTAAVEHVAAWLTSPDPARALAARLALQEVAGQDVPAVAQVARALLDRRSPPPRHSVQLAPEPVSAPEPASASEPVSASEPDPAPAAANPDPPSAPSNAPDLARLAGYAELAALAVDVDRRKARSLAEVATVVAVSDPAHAQRIAQAIPDDHARANALVRVTRAAVGDPSKAEQVALSITGQAPRADALIEVIRAVVLEDPVRAVRLAAQAERDILASAVGEMQAAALLRLVAALAVGSPADAERAARAIADHRYRVSALIVVADAMAATDPARAARLGDQAEGAALLVGGGSARAFTLLTVAKAVAGTDPIQATRLINEAERNALANTEPSRAETLIAVASAVASEDAPRAARLISEAARVTGTIPDVRSRADVLLTAVRTIAPIDPAFAGQLADRAARAARAISDPHERTNALGDIAAAIAPIKPAGAKGIALNLADPTARGAAALMAVKAIAAVDPVNIPELAHFATLAEQGAIALSDAWDRGSALFDLVASLANADPALAERLALAITHDSWRARALALVVAAVAAHDPDRAARLASQAEHAALVIADGPSRADALLAILKVARNPARAARLTDQIERACLAAPDDKARAATLTTALSVVASLNPDQAKRMADGAERAALALADPYTRMKALVALAEAVAIFGPDHLTRVVGSAEGTALSIADPQDRATALTRLMKARQSTGY
jgi:hypothetical protein